MKTIKLNHALPDEEIDKLAGTFLDESHYDRLIAEDDVKVLKPNGDVLLIHLHNILPAPACKAAFPGLRKAASTSENRGMAAGIIPEKVSERKGNRAKKAAVMDGTRLRPMKQDGTVSNTNYAQAVHSGIIGFYDRYPRIPYCRLTAFNLYQPEKFQAAMPLIRAIDEAFKKNVPGRYAAQLKVVKQTSPDFVIHKTAFTTITVNKNWVTALHKDKGDLTEGFGVMTALRAGHYSGCYLCFPKYRVAVDMRTRSLLLADVHEWHGNTPLIGIEGAFERISLVCYYRQGMVSCGSAAEELARAKKIRMGDLTR